MRPKSGARFMRDVHVAAPDVVEPHAGELREHPPHARAGGLAGVARVDPRVAHPPAEQQPVVGRAAEVVEHEVHVGDRDVLADQRRDAFLAQRLGRHDVGADRHHPPVWAGTCRPAGSRRA